MYYLLCFMRASITKTIYVKRLIKFLVMRQTKMTNSNSKVALYCRLSKDDEQAGDSVSVGTQRMMLTKFCKEHSFEIFDIYIKNISGYTYVEISSAISYSTAKSRVALGLCVFTVTKSEPRQLASNFPPIVGPEKGAKDSGQYMHYHVRGRVNKSHIFFLF